MLKTSAQSEHLTALFVKGLMRLTEESGLLMPSLCKEIKLCWREVGAGGEGNARGARAIDFKQGT
jgi:hypothetical protein